MFQFGKKIASVQSVKSIDNQLFICFKKGIFIDEQMVEDIECQSFDYKHQSFLYNTQKGDFCILKKNKSFVFKNAGFCPTSFDGKSILLQYDNAYDSLKDQFKFKVGLFDMDTQLKIRDYENMENMGVYDFVNPFYICRSAENKILAFSAETGQCHWTVAFAEKKIVKYHNVVSHGLLFSYHTEDNRSGAIYLDTQTGNVIWNKIMAGFDAHYAINSRNTTLLSIKSGGLWEHGVQKVKGSNIFLEMDLKTGDYVRKGVLHELDEADLQVHTFVVKEHSIYFTANHQGSFGAIAIGVLSLKTLKLLWWKVVQMDDAGGFGNFLLNTVVVAGNQLGILDKTGVLHLFEKNTELRRKNTKKSGLIYLDESIAPSPVETNDNLPF